MTAQDLAHDNRGDSSSAGAGVGGNTPLTSPSPTSNERKQKAARVDDNMKDARVNPMNARRSMQDEGTNDASRCRHLEECMFPRFLSLDCKQLDDFCTGCVKVQPNAKNIGRIYIEALHLKDFVKSPETIAAEAIGKGKRGRPESPSKKKSRSSPLKRKGDEQVTDNSRLSQAYFGGVEGKRTWFLTNSHGVGKGGGVAGSYCQILPRPTLGPVEPEEDSSFLKTAINKSKHGVSASNEALDNLLASEVKLSSLRKSMRLHDHTVPFDSHSELENLVKPLPGYIPPSAGASQKPSSGGLVPAPIASSATADKPVSSPNVPSQSMDVDVGRSEKRKESDEIMSSPERSRIVSTAPDTPASSSSALSKKGDFSPENDGAKITSNEHDAVPSDVPPTSYDRALHEGKEAALAANKLLDSFRQNRRNFWSQKLRNGKAQVCAWCPGSKRCSSKPRVEFGAINDTSSLSNEDDHSRGNDSDGLIQCLECNLIGCSPKFADGEEGGHQHIMLHFLMSGHRFGVSCGPKGELFCFGCGDAVYHECFDQERERIYLEQNIPSLCWKETPILRGVDPSSFTVTPENGFVWRGMMASYPTPVSAHLVQASQYAAKRLSIFRGDIGGGSMDFGAKAVELSIHQQGHLKGRCIPKPVGMYNMGNTCYMSSTLQCMIHCQPLQDLFLRELAHPCQTCHSLRRGGNKASCLTCEMDKLFLEYFGSAVGIDAIAALEEPAEPTSESAPQLSKPDDRGHPLIPSGILAECWRNRTMKNVAGHGQHDAQEFYNAFVDLLSTHDTKYRQLVEEMKGTMYEPQVKQPLLEEVKGSRFGADFIRKMFMGTLRSVLICLKCGCKRTQTEEFSNVSLPLAKELTATDPQAKSNTRRGKITVRSILDHFTRPENLADPVHCPSCNSKTKTLKQSTFATLPNVLCLHLKRFDSAANKKITDFVPFPTDLDMGKHLPHWRERGLERKEGNHGHAGGQSSHEPRAGSPKVLYDLFATVDHKGTLHQGHYVANVKSGDCWYSCNDAFVSPAGDGDGQKEVLSSEGAYMLFYQKR